MISKDLDFWSEKKKNIKVTRAFKECQRHFSDISDLKITLNKYLLVRVVEVVEIQ